MTDLEVVGRHALLFDDDANAAFVNSAAALVEWNSLSIDRYDVRHLLSSPPPPRGRRHPSSLSPSSEELELDRERYLDLPSPSDDQQGRKCFATLSSTRDTQLDGTAEPVSSGSFNAVPFSYGSTEVSTDLKKSEAETCFHPPFPVPDSLLHNLPPTEKLHQIIARTATFVSKHGPQSEIVLRVKQGDNPTFGFLMPDHHLHPYFRFLVDHQELLKSDMDGKTQEENCTGSGSLSLLGSVYGYGEDEDGGVDIDPQLERREAKELDCSNRSEAEKVGNKINSSTNHQSEQTDSSVKVMEKNEEDSKNSLAMLKEKVSLIKKNRVIGNVKAGTKSGTRKGSDTSVSKSGDKLQSSASPSTSKVELPILEPSSELKRVMEKIVEFILKNGKEFEAILIEQDVKHGRFPFLLASNQYNPYYLKLLEKAQESKLPGKSTSEKQDLLADGMDKRTSSRDYDKLSYSGHDVPYDFDKKEKFKMVLGKSRKDGQDPPSKTTPQIEVSVDATAAAAILQAARRGIKNPNLGILSKPPINGIGQGAGSDSGQVSSFGSLPSSQPQNSNQISNQSCEVNVPVANAIAKTAALAAASEADSSEACLNREQKLKAERLKRAKMFAAMIKSGVAPLQSESQRSLSAEPPSSVVSGAGTEVGIFASKEREGSSVPLDGDTVEKDEKSDKVNIGSQYNERAAKRRYRVRSRANDKEEDDDDDDDAEEEGKGVEEAEKEDKDRKSSRKKKRSHSSSHHSRERHKHRKRHSSSKERHSRHRHKHKNSSDGKHRRSRHQHKHDSSSDDEDQLSHQRYKHTISSDEEVHRSCRKDKTALDEEHQRSPSQQKKGSSSDAEHQPSRHRHRRRSSDSDDEQQYHSRSVEHKRSHSKMELDLEEGEISTKSDQPKAGEGDNASREASTRMSKSCPERREPFQPSEVNDVSDDLRAKVRAMLANLL